MWIFYLQAFVEVVDILQFCVDVYTYICYYLLRKNSNYIKITAKTTCSHNYSHAVDNSVDNLASFFFQRIFFPYYTVYPKKIFYPHFLWIILWNMLITLIKPDFILFLLWITFDFIILHNALFKTF